MIKQEVPITTMHRIGELISHELNLETMNYFLESSSIPTILYDEVTARIPYNNSDRFNKHPHKHGQLLRLIISVMKLEINKIIITN